MARQARDRVGAPQTQKEVKRQLYKKQEEHADVLREALDNHRAALDASSTGCGKTLVAAEIALTPKRFVLVVCLKNSIPMWEDELKERGVKKFGVINYDMLRTGKTKWGRWVPNTRLFEFTLPADSLIIWDEVQKCQGLDTKNSKMLIGAKPFVNLMLSATAVENPSEMRALGYILGLHSLKDFIPWCKKRGCFVNQWRGWDFRDPGHKHLIALHNEIFPAHGSRLRVRDLAEHFQETQIIMTPLQFGANIEKIYEQMESELAALADVVKTDTKNPAAERLIARLRARQKVELCKVPLMLDMTADLLKEGRSVALLVNFSATIDALVERLGAGVGVIRGNQPEENKRVMKAFQADEIRVVVCNMKAGSASINLHDLNGNHPRTSLISPSDDAKDVLQAVGRIHRAGGKTPSQQHVLFAAGTIEVLVKKNCDEKMLNMDIFNDGVLEEKDPNIPAKNIDSTPGISQDGPPVTDQETEHAKYNPSSLSMWEKCPGYKNREGTNAQAEMGTRAHKALEKDKIDSLPEKERPMAQNCQDYIDGVIQEHLPAQPDQHLREVRLYIDLGGDLTTFGTCDRLILYGPHGEMLDFKFGRMSITDAEVNAQAWAYVIGAFQQYPQLKTITFTFLIPYQDEVSTHTFKRGDVPSMTLRLNTVIRRAMEIGADLEANFKHLNPQSELCEFCAQQARCPAIVAKALKFAKNFADGLPVPDKMVVSADRPQDITHLLRLAPILENVASQIKSDALKINLEEGLEIPDFVRQERSTPRSITSVAGAWDIAKEHGVQLEDFLLACGTISIVDLEDAVAACAPARGKGKARQKLENDLRAADLLREQSTYHYLREKRS